jgi:hypothetical protein
LQKNFGNDRVSHLEAEQIENQPVSEEKFVRIEAAMGNAKYERARARARLALIAPTVDDVTAAYFNEQVEKVLLEARQREPKSDRELVSALLDAVARKFFSMSLRDPDAERSPDDPPPPPTPTKS